MGIENPARATNLVHYLRGVNLNKPHFIVLHEHACHAPYIQNYPASFNQYKVPKGAKFHEREVNNYDSCIGYIDDVYRQIYNVLKQRSPLPTYLIYDSDHGEGLGEQDGYYGHGNNQIRNVINIPIIVTGLHGASMDFAKQDKNKIRPEWVSQFALSKVVAHLLGYKVKPVFEQSHGYWVNGFRLNGTNGFRKVAVKSL